MKAILMMTILAVTLSACAEYRPTKSSCFSGGRETCKFYPLDELHAKGR